MFGTIGGFAQFAFDGGRQTLQVALHQIIVGTSLHRRYGDILADPAGDNDEGEVEAGLLQNLERLGGAETREVVVGENDVPRLAGQGGPECLGRFHALDLRIVTRLAQQADHDLRVELGIFNDYGSEQSFHVRVLAIDQGLGHVTAKS